MYLTYPCESLETRVDPEGGAGVLGDSDPTPHPHPLSGVVFSLYRKLFDYEFVFRAKTYIFSVTSFIRSMCKSQNILSLLLPR